MCKKTKEPVRVEAFFDEYNLNLQAAYNGMPMEFPKSPPSEDELTLDKTSLAKMSGFMIQFIAEKVTAKQRSNI